MRKLFPLLSLFLLCSITYATAQTTTQAWATLPSGSGPTNLTFDKFGNCYVANMNSNTVSKITANGTVISAWATLANNSGPITLITDTIGNVYTCNFYGSISKITPSGIVTQSWAVLPNNPSAQAITIDHLGNVFVANYSHNSISKVTPNGIVTQVWASFPANTNPLGLVADKFNNIYTANSNNGNIIKITPAGTISTFASLGSGNPYAMTIDTANNIYVANINGNTVSKITSTGAVTQNWGILAAGSGPHDIAIDTSGNVYTVNIYANTVSRITTNGITTQVWSTLTSGAGPTGIAIDASGNVFTANRNINTISKIEPATPLPVLMLNFNGTLKNRVAALQWNSDEDLNFQHYEIEKSSDGKTFHFLAKIEALGNNQHYQYETPQQEVTAYYRLKMLDIDGFSTVSTVITLSSKDDIHGSFTVYPVPARDRLTINTDLGGNLDIYNIIGRHINTLQLQEGINNLDISTFQSGTYIGKLRNQSLRFIVE